jgi:hypothetical protein
MLSGFNPDRFAVSTPASRFFLLCSGRGSARGYSLGMVDVPKNNVTARVVAEIEDVNDPGAVEIRRLTGQVVGLAICCPGCGSQSWLPFDGSRGWQLRSLDPLHIEPSVFHTIEAGGCGWHGFLRGGVWRSV